MSGGGAVLTHTVRMMLELREDFVCVCLDVRNAHNEISRQSVVRELEKVPGLRHLAQHVAICLAGQHSLESAGIAFGKATDGLTQGDSQVCCRIHTIVAVLEVNSFDPTYGDIYS